MPSLLLFCQSGILLRTNSESLLTTACVLYSTPGFYYEDLKETPSAKIVEVDDYGRKLLSYKDYNWLTEKEEHVYVICQKHENSTIYFYENINFAVVTESFESVDKLKQENDWNAPLDESKFAHHKIYVSFDLVLVKDHPWSRFSDDEFYLSLSEKYGIEEDEVAYTGYCDWNNKNQVLYYMELDNEEKYFLIVDKEFNVFLMKIEDPYNTRNERIELKKQTNW